MPVTCYICGRDFGTRSIKIHIPSCQKKWDIEQDKLPKSQRRECPKAPEEFEKVLSGELKGKALQRMNQQAFEDYNDQALQPCEYCSRTFLPKSLNSHQKMCTPDNPMTKQPKEKSYTGQAKSRVKYPSLKPKAKQTTQQKIKDPEKIDLPLINDNCKISPSPTPATTASAPTPVTTASAPTPTAVAAAPTAEEEEELAVDLVPMDEGGTGSSGSSNRSSLLEPEHSLSEEDSLEDCSDPNSHLNINTVPGQDLDTDPTLDLNVTTDSNQTKNTEPAPGSIYSPSNNHGTTPSLDQNTLNECNPKKPPGGKPPSGRGPGTLVKKSTYTSNPSNPTRQIGISKDILIQLIEDSDILEDEKHRIQVYTILREYIRDARTKQLRSLLSEGIFLEDENCQEALEILQEFVKLKSNNNNIV